jgi:hypothetical protein
MEQMEVGGTDETKEPEKDKKAGMHIPCPMEKSCLDAGNLRS